ncbi:MAG: bifunctional adenosylcobinamide kinase/adenosylcobinamide-phosphate guanylyltransferase, partial [Lachnospirales bacterium]
FYSVMTDKFGTDYSAIDKEIASFSEEEKNNMEKIIMTEWLSIVSAVRDIPGDVIIVTNEVGWGIVPENPFSRWFRDIYGRVNQYLGKKSDAVYLVVAGIPMEIKK